jgi:hypothetical protein
MAMYDIIMKGRLHNLSIECQLDLFDKIVKPILLYGCGREILIEIVKEFNYLGILLK